MAIALRRQVGRDPDGDTVVRTVRGRRRISILSEFLAALVSVVIISAALTGLFEERMTKSALSTEANRLTNSQLGVVVAAYEAREVTLAVNLRYLAEQLNVRGATVESHFTDLVSELSQTASSLDIDMLGVFDSKGEFVAGEGRMFAGTDVVTKAAPGLRSQLVPTGENTYKRVLASR
ncbi:MAG TPA: hypothetical protein VEU28_10185, partial [Actinomycetota bacterium]|nr:hypothetical protein [Actinomycetota bacterium]